jgi:hypothetical protein
VPASSPRARYRRILARKRAHETLRALAERHGVKPMTFYHWHQRYKTSEPEAEPAGDDEPGLLPVELSTSAGREFGSLLSPGFEVALRRSGHVVRVPARFEPAALARLLSVLEQA